MLTTDATDFAAALPALGRLLALDIGTRTIGLATASADWRFATARETLKRTKPSADMEALRAMAAKEDIRGLVIGLPLNMDGSDSERTQSVRAQARNLLKGIGLPILLWDERWSTAAVERALIAADVSRAKRAERVDALAAAHILDGALARLAALGDAA
ncbi:Holliday junction resolvase RuvX [Sandaracinobacter neustonicus]|uniref:Holliday junction resolvase RuvX n=1 Tax=Sandaracinobacter neustonicus TaxID=1715348 RepID=UPI0038B45C5F